MAEYAALLMFLAAFAFLLLGYPVAITLAGTALLTAGIGVLSGELNPRSVVSDAQSPVRHHDEPDTDGSTLIYSHGRDS